MLHQPTRIKTFLASAAALILAACNPEAPVGTPAVSAETANLRSDSLPFSYYGDERIFFTVDSARVVLVAENADAVAQDAFANRAGRADSVVQLRSLPNTAVIYAGRAAAGRAIAALRSDGRSRFVSFALKAVRGGGDVVPVNRVVVKLSNEATPGDLRRLADSAGLMIEREPDAETGPRVYWLTVPAGRDPVWQIAARLHEHRVTEWADFDRVEPIVRNMTPNDTHFGSQFHLKSSNVLNGVTVDVQAEAAWDVTLGSSSVTVAVIDEGVQASHPDLSGKVVAHWDAWSIAGESGAQPCTTCYHPESGHTGDAHGTAVAGIIAANTNNSAGIAGLAPNVNLISARIFRGPNAASAAQIAAAINWAWNTGGAHVLNLSWGSPSPNTTIRDAIVNAMNYGRGGKGTAVAAAVGNDYPCSPFFPASMRASGYPAMISVAALDRYGSRASYSCTGLGIVVTAPAGDIGDGVATTDLTGSPGYNSGLGSVDYTQFNGTSAATPQAAGTAALLLSREPAIVGYDVMYRIRLGAHAWGDPNQFGAGKLSAYGTLNSMKVNISGPTRIISDGWYSYKAIVQGGLGSGYSYVWERNDGGGWYVVTTSPTYDPYIATYEDQFDLRVTVTSGPSVGVGTFIVTPMG